jgi:hypothetical protein
MKNIEFQNATAFKIYEDYIKRVKRTTATLSAEDKSDILMEFNSHIFEAMQLSSEISEVDNLMHVIERLGSPEEVLLPLVADKKLAQATSTFNPVHVFKALALNISNGVSYVVFSLLYLMLFAFAFLIFAKIFSPENVGLFYGNNGFTGSGLSFKATQLEGTREILGWWFIPWMVITAAVLYAIITLLLKLKRGKKLLHSIGILGNRTGTK